MELLNCNKDDREYLGEVMSNFDHSIDKKIETQLKNKLSYADYPGWDFHGTVWYENDMFHCKVMQYRCHVDTISAETLDEIMEEVSDKYGYE
jgi:hypothetical protein